MKKLVCIIAHPDDEAFMIGGTIAKFAKDHEIYVICATSGEAGKKNSSEEKTLGEIRAEELKASAAVLGVKDVFFLGFEDGTLSNNLYHQLADKIQEKLEMLRPDTIMTLNPNGNSGHIDHMVISYVSTYVFYKLSFIKTMLLFCTDAEFSSRMKDYFIYWPKGYTKEEVDMVVDVSDVWEQKLEAMSKHTSQVHDMERILERKKDLPKEDYFLVVEKDKV
jgi:LmbE family N-acetylglucosaminyl deacetylase